VKNSVAIKMRKVFASKLISVGFFAAVFVLLWRSGEPVPAGAEDSPSARVEADAAVAPRGTQVQIPHTSNPFEAQLAKQKLGNSKDMPAATVIAGTEDKVPLGRDPFADFLQQQRTVQVSPFAEPVAKP
jgi:hypothetical protein